MFPVSETKPSEVPFCRQYACASVQMGARPRHPAAVEWRGGSPVHRPRTGARPGPVATGGAGSGRAREGAARPHRFAVPRRPGPRGHGPALQVRREPEGVQGEGIAAGARLEADARTQRARGVDPRPGDESLLERDLRHLPDPVAARAREGESRRPRSPRVRVQRLASDPINKRVRLQYSVWAILCPEYCILTLLLWWAVLGSNQWPLPCEGSALPLS